MNLAKKTLVLALTSAVLTALAACDKSGATAGENLDKALDKTGDAVKDAGDAIKPR